MVDTKAGHKGGHPVRKLINWSIVLLSAGLVLIVALNVRLPPGANSPLVTPGPAVTFATSPLKANGDVDYLGFLHQKYGEGVSPETNFAVDLVQIVGPRPDDREVDAKFFEMLGTEVPPVDGQYHETLDRWLKRQGTAANFNRQLQSIVNSKVQLTANDFYGLALSMPLNPEVFTDILQWRDEMSPLLERIRHAAEKGHRYTPILGDSFFAGRLPYAMSVREVARSLCVSALSHIAEGNIDAAITDYRAIARMARLYGDSGPLVEHLVGLALEGVSHQVLRHIVYSGLCTADNLERLATELTALGEMPVWNTVSLTHERCYVLEMARSLGRRDFSSLNEMRFGLGSNESNRGAWRSYFVDWKSVLHTINSEYDQLDSLLTSFPTGIAHFSALEDREQSLANWVNRQWQNERPNLPRWIFGGPVFRGQVMAHEIASFASIEPISKADRRVLAHFRVLATAVAIERYRVHYGENPKTLEALVPEFLQVEPIDLWTGKTLVYRVSGDTYQLYSVGQDRRDHGGADMEEESYPEYDLVAVPKKRTIEEWLMINTDFDPNAEDE
ncbi:MAG TPA: hypothetical protein PKD54_04415 [Pirellulaceae bacterium]|nr:hypothetical protein [Pirellulaceae bacterium]